ncbi:MAG: hypothetical protein K0R57_433 [Paenibacillaceae bacterium]|jgi:hypothetical protein|nr:hypothetical protein [Paenibacillaceae bacterium]
MNKFKTRAMQGLILGLALFALAGCAEKTPEETDHTGHSPSPGAATPTVAATASGTAASYKDVDVKKLLEEFSLRKRTAASVSARPLEVLITEKEGDSAVSVPLPKDAFFLSIAPYVDSTHPCANHNLVTCKGELANKVVHVKVVDGKGTAIIDKDVTTYANGFLDLWVPRDQKLDVTISYEGKKVTETVGTSSTDRTCVSTMQLS